MLLVESGFSAYNVKFMISQEVTKVTQLEFILAAHFSSENLIKHEQNNMYSLRFSYILSKANIDYLKKYCDYCFEFL